MARRRSLLFIGFVLVLVLSPLGNGASAEWAWPLATLALFLLGMASLLSTPPSSPLEHDAALGSRWWTLWAALWGMWLLYSALQLVPLPRGVLAWIAPRLDAQYVDAVPGFAEGRVWHPLAVAPAGGLRGLIMLAACATAFGLTARLCHTRARVRQLATALFAVAVLQAVLGLATPRDILSAPATGTFQNRNHFAAFLVMALMVGTGLLYDRWQRHARADSSSQDRLVLLTMGCGLLFIVAAVLCSFSRAGFLTMLAGGSLLLALGPAQGQPRRVALGAAFLLTVLLATGSSVFDVLLNRFATFETEDLSRDARVVAWQASLTLLHEYGLSGTGLGGFQDAFARRLGNEAGFTRLTWNHAHSDPLELLIESGLVVGSLVLLGLALYMIVTYARWRRCQVPYQRALGGGCLAATATTLAHSLVDFPFHISTIGLWTAVLLALGWRTVHVDA